MTIYRALWLYAPNGVHDTCWIKLNIESARAFKVVLIADVVANGVNEYYWRCIEQCPVPIEAEWEELDQDGSIDYVIVPEDISWRVMA